MGIIRKQAIKGSVYIYLGAIIALVTRVIFFPRFLETEEIGLLDLLISYSVIFAQFASLGFNSVTTRLFTYFRDDEKKHNGFLFLATAVSLVGFVLAIIAFFIAKPFIIDDNIGKGLLLVEYFHYIIPLILFTLFFNLFDNYNRVLYNATRGIFIKEFAMKILILVSTLLFYLKYLSFDQFVLIYVLIFCLPTVAFAILLAKDNQLSFKPNFNFLEKGMLYSIISVSFFGIINSASGVLTLNIDRIMISEIIGEINGLQMTGIYTTTFFFGTIIILPSRALLKISSTFIADAWKSNDKETLNIIYKKTSLIQFIIGSLLLIGIWANIDNVLDILKEKFYPGKYVVLFIGLSYLIDMISGAGSSILTTSKYYKVQSLFMVILVVMIIIFNFILIPMYGISGAAFATLLAKFIYNLIRFFYLKRRFNMQPYDYRFLLVAGISIISYAIGYFIPSIRFEDNLFPYFDVIIDLFVRSSTILVLFMTLVLSMKISDDINSRYHVFKDIILRKVGLRS